MMNAAYENVHTPELVISHSERISKLEADNESTKKDVSAIFEKMEESRRLIIVQTATMAAAAIIGVINLL
jgi:hypothetical protein